MKPGLGTQLRHLIDLLDGAVSDAYTQTGLDYRPRYTPVMRALEAGEAHTIGHIAERAGITQSAATQTVNLMLAAGLLVAVRGTQDARQKLVGLSDSGRALLPELQRCWHATKNAADSLDRELPHPLSETLARAIDALKRQPFGARIAQARAKQSNN